MVLLSNLPLVVLTSFNPAFVSPVLELIKVQFLTMKYTLES